MKLRPGLLAIRLSLCMFSVLLASSQAGSARPDEKPQRVTIGGKEMAQKLRTKVKPVYPEEAKRYKIEGTVKLHVIVGVDGTMQQIQVVSGHPLLVRSAMDAVRQWTYEPVAVNGRPVEVNTEIDVTYQLGK